MRPRVRDCNVQMKFDVPRHVREGIEKSADANMRSLRGEIIWRLAKSLEDYPPADDETAIAPGEM